MSPDILIADKRARIYLSVQQTVLDIDGILTKQIEQCYQFSCKNGGKMTDYTYDLTKSHFQTLPIINTQFLWQPDRI